MINADATATGLFSRVVADANEPSSRPVKAVIEAVEQVRLAVLKVAPNRVRTEIRQLNHRSEPAVHEQRRLNKPAHPAVGRASRVVLSRELSKTPRRGLVLILYDKAYLDLLPFQVVVKTRHYLLERMLEDSVLIAGVGGLSLSIREYHGVCPVPDLIRRRAQDVQPLVMRQMDIGQRLLVVLRELLYRLGSANRGFGEVLLTLMQHRPLSGVWIKAREIRDALLLRIHTCHPCRMDLAVEVPRVQNLRYLRILVSPRSRRDRET